MTTRNELALALAPRIKEVRSLAPSEHYSPERLCRQAAVLWDQSPKLRECSVQSILACVYRTAELGLDLAPQLGQAYLIPRKGVCCLQIGYKGHLTMLWRHPMVRDVYAVAVHAGDKFSYQLGTSPRIEHVPSRQADRGPVTASYAVANFRSFGQVFRVCEQIDLDRARSVSQNTSPDSPWKMWPEAMAAKTAILRLRSLIPVDSQVADLWAMVNQTEADEAEDKAPTIEAVTVEAVPQRSPFADLPPETEDVAEPDQPAQTSEITAEDIDAAMSRAAKVNQR